MLSLRSRINKLDKPAIKLDKPAIKLPAKVKRSIKTVRARCSKIVSIVKTNSTISQHIHDDASSLASSADSYCTAPCWPSELPPVDCGQSFTAMVETALASLPPVECGIDEIATLVACKAGGSATSSLETLPPINCEPAFMATLLKTSFGPIISTSQQTTNGTVVPFNSTELHSSTSKGASSPESAEQATASLSSTLASLSSKLATLKLSLASLPPIELGSGSVGDEVDAAESAESRRESGQLLDGDLLHDAVSTDLPTLPLVEPTGGRAEEAVVTDTADVSAADSHRESGQLFDGEMLLRSAVPPTHSSVPDAAPLARSVEICDVADVVVINGHDDDKESAALPSSELFPLDDFALDDERDAYDRASGIGPSLNGLEDDEDGDAFFDRLFVEYDTLRNRSTACLLGGDTVGDSTTSGLTLPTGFDVSDSGSDSDSDNDNDSNGGSGKALSFEQAEAHFARKEIEEPAAQEVKPLAAAPEAELLGLAPLKYVAVAHRTRPRRTERPLCPPCRYNRFCGYTAPLPDIAEEDEEDDNTARRRPLMARCSSSSTPQLSSVYTKSDNDHDFFNLATGSACTLGDAQDSSSDFDNSKVAPCYMPSPRWV